MNAVLKDDIIQRSNEDGFISDWARGWNQGRLDSLNNLRDKLVPSDERILRSAELTFRFLSKKFTGEIDSVFAGYNFAYDEPSMLVVLKDEANPESRMKVICDGSDFVQELYDNGGLAVSVLCTRLKTTDFEQVAKDYKYKRVYVDA